MHGAMRSRSSSTVHASSTGTSTRNSSSICMLIPPSTPPSREVVEGVDVAPDRRCRCSRPRPPRGGSMSARAPVVTVERVRLGHSDRAQQHRVPPHPAVRRHGERRAPSSYAAASRRYASAPTSGWSASPTHTAVDLGVAARARRARPAASGRCRGSSRCARTTTTPSVAAPADRRRSRDRRRARPDAARDAVAASSAHDTSGRPRSSSSGLGTSPPSALAPAGREDRDRGPPSSRRGLQRPPHQHPGEVLAVLGRRVEVGRAVGALGRVLRGVGDRRAARERGLDPGWPAAASSPCSRARRGCCRSSHRDRADDRPVLGPPVELLVREPVAPGLAAPGSR